MTEKKLRPWWTWPGRWVWIPGRWMLVYGGEDSGEA